MKPTAITALVAVLAVGGGGFAQQTSNGTMRCRADPRLPASDGFAEALCPLVFHCNATAAGAPPVRDDGPLGAAGDQLAHAEIDCGELCVCS